MRLRATRGTVLPGGATWSEAGLHGSGAAERGASLLPAWGPRPCLRRPIGLEAGRRGRAPLPRSLRAHVPPSHECQVRAVRPSRPDPEIGGSVQASRLRRAEGSEPGGAAGDDSALRGRALLASSPKSVRTRSSSLPAEQADSGGSPADWHGLHCGAGLQRVSQGRRCLVGPLVVRRKDDSNTLKWGSSYGKGGAERRSLPPLLRKFLSGCRRAPPPRTVTAAPTSSHCVCKTLAMPGQEHRFPNKAEGILSGPSGVSERHLGAGCKFSPVRPKDTDVLLSLLVQGLRGDGKLNRGDSNEGEG